MQGKQYGKVDHEQQDDAAHVNCLICKEQADCVHVRSRTLDEFSRLGFIMVREGKSLDVIE